MQSKEKFLWEIVSEILENHGDIVDDIHIIEDSNFDTETRKIYCSKGYCFELQKEDFSDLTEDEIHDDLDDDGFCYSFCEPWDGFKVAGIDKAIELLNSYAGLAFN